MKHYLKNSIILRILSKYLILAFISFQVSIAQTNNSQYFSEAPVYFENGTRYSNQVIVNFNNKVFDLPQEKNIAEENK